MKTIFLLFAIWFGTEFGALFYKPTDFRDAYCGNYNCLRGQRQLDTERNEFVSSVTNYTVSISKSQTDSVFNVSLQEGDFKAKFINGQFQCLNVRCFGRFSGDSLYLTFIPALGPSSIGYKGKK